MKLRRAVLVALVLGGGLILVLASLQRRLLYFPVRQDPARATAEARARGLEPWAPAGAFLGWRAPARSATPRASVVVLHGNAGTALDRSYHRDVLQAADPGLEVVLLEYPGYGPREGSPSQRSLVAACREAVGRLRSGGRAVVLAGESLGSAVAALCAAEVPDVVAGVVLVTPLASVPAVARRHYPFVPGFLVRDAYRADEALPRYPGPVAFLVAGRDEVTFTDLGLALHAARAGPKWLWVEERAGHNTLPYDPSDPRWRELVEFVLPAR